MAEKKNKLTHYLILIMVIICMVFILVDLSTNIISEVASMNKAVGTSIPIQPTPTFDCYYTPPAINNNETKQIYK